MTTIPVTKDIIFPVGDKNIILEKGDLLLIHEKNNKLREIEKYESSNFDVESYNQLMNMVKKWGQYFEYNLGIHFGFIIKDLIREGIRFNENDSVQPFLDGYDGSFEI